MHLFIEKCLDLVTGTYTIGMLLGLSGASLLGNLLTGKDKIRAGKDLNGASSFNNFSNTKILSKWN